MIALLHQSKSERYFSLYGNRPRWDTAIEFTNLVKTTKSESSLSLVVWQPDTSTEQFPFASLQKSETIEYEGSCMNRDQTYSLWGNQGCITSNIRLNRSDMVLLRIELSSAFILLVQVLIHYLSNTTTTSADVQIGTNR